MDERSERVTSVVAKTLGNTINPAVTGVITLAGVALGRPDLALLAVPLGAAAGVFGEEAVLRLREEWAGDRAERVATFVQASEDAAGVSVDDLLKDVKAQRPLKHLMAESVEATTEAVSDWKIRTFAHAFVHGYRDAAKIDKMRYLVKLVRNIDVPEVRFLAVLVRSGNGKAGINIVQQLDPELADICAVAGENLVERGLAIKPRGIVRWEIQLTPVGNFVAGALDEIARLKPID